ncbi:glutathione transferase [Artemisia annua]|uniref:Glutathione transferase n=1 Tax=Artemisia annua TaxID=35608 RepID=A0A2U1M970_ARTAN|nr:glutathione transferase [Artemisia annua]
MEVDIAYAPFIERFQLCLLDVNKYDIKGDSPTITTWVKELIESYNMVNKDLYGLLSQSFFAKSSLNVMVVSFPGVEEREIDMEMPKVVVKCFLRFSS